MKDINHIKDVSLSIEYGLFFFLEGGGGGGGADKGLQDRPSLPYCILSTLVLTVYKTQIKC